MIYNQKYFDHLYIKNRLARQFKQKQFNDDDVLVWCQEVELEVLADVENMVTYDRVDIVLCNGILTLPCNVYRLLDVYDSSENRILYQSNGKNLYGLMDMNGNTITDDTTIYINYKGNAIDLETGIPLCLRSHEFVCENYCKIKAFEEDILLQKISASMYQYWTTQLAGMITATKQNYMHKDRAQVNDIAIIHGNMISRIGHLPLAHTMFIQQDSNDII